MRLGIGSYALTWSIGVNGYESPLSTLIPVDLLHKAKKLGAEVVQLADNIPLHELHTKELQDIKDTARELELTLEVGTKGSHPEHLLQYLDLAAFFESSMVRTLITTEDMGQAEKDINAVLHHYQNSNIRLAIENHGLHTTKQLTDLFDSLNSPFIGCCLDTVNSFGALESPEEVFQALSPYVLNLHIKDFEIKRLDHMMGYSVTGTPAGKGRLDIPKVIKKLEDRDISGVLELWVPYQNSVEDTIRIEDDWLNESMSYLKICMAKSNQ